MLHIPDKFKDKRTTTKKFKQDLYSFILEKKVRTVLEIGCYYGYTAYVLAPLLKTITCVDIDPDCIDNAKNNNKGSKNIYYRNENVYKTIWTYGYHDLVLLDCGHSEEHIISDINNTLTHIKPKFIAFDDYGLFPEVRKVVDTNVKEGALSIIRKMGYGPGTLFSMSTDPNTVPNKILEEYEGVICKCIL